MTGRRGRAAARGCDAELGLGALDARRRSGPHQCQWVQVVPNPSPGVGSILAGDSQGVPAGLLAAASAGDGSRDATVTGLKAGRGWSGPHGARYCSNV